jgi:hypothetical protein
MTGLDVVLAAVFAAVWLAPLTMAVRWERRLRANRRTPPAPHARAERRREAVPR